MTYRHSKEWQAAAAESDRLWSAWRRATTVAEQERLRVEFFRVTALARELDMRDQETASQR